MRHEMAALAALLTLGCAGLYAQAAKEAAPAPAGKNGRYAAISTPDHHEGPSEMTPDEKVLFYTRSARDFSTATLRSAIWKDGAWHDQGPVSFSGTGYDSGASLTPDGGRLYFTSKRPGAGFPDEWNIWVAERAAGGGWGAPRPLEAPVNSDKFDCCLIAKAGTAVYFSSERDGTWDIFRATVADGRFSAPEKLPAGISGPHGEWPSYVDPQDRFLIFSSIRPDGEGGDDIYISFRRPDGWTAPRSLGPRVNTKDYEDGAILSADGKRLLWSRRPQGTPAEILEIDVAELGIPELTAAQ